MEIKNIKIYADEGISEDEIKQIVAEEHMLWLAKGKTLGAVHLTIAGDEIVIKAVEKSPIRRVRRITGYLSEIDRFGDSKKAELFGRVTHV